MKQMKVLGVLAVAMTLGLTACGGTKECATHKWGKWTVTKEATCTEAGEQERVCEKCKKKETKAINPAHKYGDWTEVTPSTCQVKGKEKRVCSVCQHEEERELDLAEHSWGDWEEVTPADCTNAGSRKHKCTVCDTEESEEVAALGHQWVKAEDQTGAIAPTCTEGGTEVQECSVCHEKQTVTVAELGHDFPAEGRELEIPGPTETNTKGEVPYHWAKITNYSCTRGDSYRYAWSAKEVNFDYKNVAEGAEPELLDEGEDGIRFWGRPIGNAMQLSSEGRASSNDDEKIPDESVKGSRFEFDFVFDTDVNDVCLSADLTPAQYTNDIFKNRPQDQEWTPGYKFVDDVDEDGNPIRKAVKIEGMRFIILLDGVEVPLDANVDTAPNGRRWYQFPCKLNLTAGKHNLNIAMAGGYLHTFYSFSFEKVAPAHEHTFAAATTQADEAESTIASCVKGDQTKINWSAKKFNAAASQVGTADSTENGSNGIKFSGDGYNKTKNADPNVGDHAVYNVNVPAAQTEAQLLMRFNRKDKVVAFSAPSGDQSPSYVLDEATGKTTETKYGWRYKLFVNDVEVEFTPYTTENPEPQTTAKAEVEFAFPCTIALQAGVNKIELQKWGGYTATIVDFSLVY